MKRLNITCILLLCLLHLPALVHAQQANPATPGELLLSLQKLNTTGAVLYIAAHPDDENTRLLAYLANERKLRTGYLSLTRGDGGQNLIGKEQGEMLGLLRTQELLAARRVDGAEQFFTRANDFGFSKNPEETFTIWNREQVLGDVVWTIRKFRPDVIICRFPTTGEGGHGHHTASAILAAEAFDAAADPKRFPEQLKYVSVWQPRRLFWNTFNFGTTNTITPEQLKINVGMYNPLLGKSYGEIAAESRTMHKSQGFGTAKSRGESFEYFKQLRGDSVKTDLFEGINTGWARSGAMSRLAPIAAELVDKFNPLKPEASVSGLVRFHKELFALQSKYPAVQYWRALKLSETQILIAACAGLWAEATVNAFSAVPGDEVPVNAQILSRNSTAFTLKHISFPGGKDSALVLKLAEDMLYSFPDTVTLPRNTPFSAPYWLSEPHAVASYIVKDPQMIGKPENDFMPKVRFALEVEGLPMVIERNIVFKSTDPVKGEIYRPLEILPPVTIAVADNVLAYSGIQEKELTITVRANRDNVKGTILVPPPYGWKAQLSSTDLNLARKGDEAVYTVMVENTRNSKNDTLEAMVEIDGQVYTQSIRRFEYDHVPYQFMLGSAAVKLENIDLKTAGKSIGYIPGAGDDVPAALAQVGYTVTPLTNDMLAAADLSQFDAIVAGVRAYNTNEQLPRYHDRLMSYIQQGGNYIVQYNTNTRLGPMTAQPGPWPFTITNKRVTDENAAVTFINPDHAALNYPNKITQKDFSGWVQERGIYFAADSAQRYETVLAMNDKGEEPNAGSLIIGKYGKGNFVYTGLVFFRQLPAGNPGAYRLFVNLLSLPRNEGKK